MAKLLTETYTLPAHWASYLVNGDDSGLDVGEALEVGDWLRGRPFLCEALSCENSEEFSLVNAANSLAGSTVEVTFSVRLFRESEGLKYLIFPAYPTFEPLGWQKRGRSFTSSGYGKKIPTTHVLYLFGRRYRIYCDIYSNAGTSYIIYQGEKVIVE